jgi:uncharacterized caspase-like protein
MFRPTCWLLLVPAVFAAPVPEAQAGPRGSEYAFLVGCSNYLKSEFRELPFTGNDIRGFRDALVATGFEPDHVVVLHDDTKTPNRYLPDKARILSELDLLLDGIRPNDTLVVALSGHGLQFKDERVSYFVPIDGKVTDKSTLIPLDGKDGLYERLKACKAKKKLLFVNACRNDPTVNLEFAGKKVELADDEQKDEVPEGIAAIYACAPGQKSYYDPQRQRALFFEHVIGAWRGEYAKGGMVTLDHVFEQVVIRTKMDANKTLGVKQVPQIKREYKGEWIVIAVPVPREKADAKDARPAKGAEELFLTGVFRQGDRTLVATLKLRVHDGRVTGETVFLSAPGGMELRLEIGGTLKGTDLNVKTFRGGSQWSTWQGQLDVKNGTLTGQFFPATRADVDPTPGMMSFRRP